MDIYDQLRRDEGMRLKPYRDTVGKLTIGVGRNLDDVGLYEDEAMTLLRNDVMRVINALAQLSWTPPLSHVRFEVLVNMAFNLGVAGLLEFKKMIAAASSGDYAGAASEMLNSQWAKQVGDRAVRLARQMREGKELL